MGSSIPRTRTSSTGSGTSPAEAAGHEDLLRDRHPQADQGPDLRPGRLGGRRRLEARPGPGLRPRPGQGGRAPTRPATGSRSSPAAATSSTATARSWPAAFPPPSVAIRPVDKETPAEKRDKVRKLKKELGLSESEVAYVLGRLRDDAPYTYVKKKIPEADAARIMALKLPGVELEPATRRHYPHGSLASHVIGGISLSGDNRGRRRVPLRRRPQGQRGRADQLSRSAAAADYQTQIIKSPVPGQDLVLTIDATIQYIVEKELDQGHRRAQGGMGLHRHHGSLFRRDPGPGQLARLRRQRVPGPRGGLAEPGRPSQLRARLDLQDRHRRRGEGAEPRRLFRALRLLRRVHQDRGHDHHRPRASRDPAASLR